MQVGFMPEKRITDAIFIVGWMLEKYKMAGRKLCMVFVDLEKNILLCPKRANWVGFEKERCDAIMEKYKNIKISVKINGK